MKRLFAVLALLASGASAQTNIGEVSIDQTGNHNDVDAVCTATNLDIRDLTSASDSVAAVCSGTVAVSTSFLLDATFTGRMPAGASPADAESNTNTALSRMGSYLFGYDGTDWNRVRLDSGTFRLEVEVEGGAGAPVTSFPDNEPFNLGQVGGTGTVTAGVSGLLAVGGNIAHGTSDSGNPVKVGGLARSYGSAVTAEAAGERVDLSADRQGILFVVPFHPNSTSQEYFWTTAQTNDPVITVSSGTRICVQAYQVTYDEAGTTGVAIRCGFATSTLTTEPTDGNTAAGQFLTHKGSVPGTGINNPPGMFVCGADDEDVRCTTEATTGGTGKLMVFYFTTAN